VDDKVAAGSCDEPHRKPGEERWQAGADAAQLCMSVVIAVENVGRLLGAGGMAYRARNPLVWWRAVCKEFDFAIVEFRPNFPRKAG